MQNLSDADIEKLKLQKIAKKFEQLGVNADEVVSEQFYRFGVSAAEALSKIVDAFDLLSEAIMQININFDDWLKSLPHDRRKEMYQRRYNRRTKKPLE